MSIKSKYPTIRPSLLLDFANSLSVDPRISVTRASSATRINERGVLESVAAGVPRIDFDPVTLACKGWLIEESRTNLLPYSEQFDNAAWIKTGVTIAANVITAPDGTLTADKLVEDTSAGAHRVAVSAFGLANNAIRCLSVFAKAAERNSVILTINAYSGNYIQATFNLLTGAVTSNAFGNGAVASARAESVGGGYWRLSLAGAPDTTSSTASCDHYVQAPGSYTGDGTSGFYIWGAQLEAGTFPTSLIPTAGAAATRAADVPVMTGSNFTSWYRQDEGTFVVESSTSARTATDKRIISVNNGTVGNNMSLHYGAPSGGVFSSVITTSGVFQFGPAETAYAADEVSKRALAYINGNPLVTTNGVPSASTGASATVVPTGLDRLEIGCRVGTQQPNGHIRRIAYYNKRLSNAELQALTTP